MLHKLVTSYTCTYRCTSRKWDTPAHASITHDIVVRKYDLLRPFEFCCMSWCASRTFFVHSSSVVFSFLFFYLAITLAIAAFSTKLFSKILNIIAVITRICPIKNAASIKGFSKWAIAATAVLVLFLNKFIFYLH